MRATKIIALTAALGVAGCAATVPKEEYDKLKEEKDVTYLQLEKKTAELVQSSEELHRLRNTHEEQRRRLQIICVDHPDHHVCAPQTAAEKARTAFCNDEGFVKHVDEIVKACHQGACKQVDDANLLSRTQYMTLVQSLPHALVLFGNAQRSLDRKDREVLQQFVEQLQAEKGYIIIVGRASKDGPWKQNLRLALNRAEETREFVVEQLGVNKDNVGYITYGHPKMYLTQMDADRLSDNKKLSAKQANRSAFVFAYPCFDKEADNAPSTGGQ